MTAPDPAFNALFEANADQMIHPNADGSSFKPLDSQRKLARLLAHHKRVIALQPTGAGKTLAATLPFAANLLAPAQMIFMTPMRSLTSAQTRTIAGRFRARTVARCLGLPERAWSVREQTGSVPNDPDFEATVTVATFDQALSSAVRLSYSASRRRRTVNAGAILGSYLVADELHLFPRGEALTTLLCLLKYRPPELPFLLMTATLTQTVAHALAGLLNAAVFDDPLSFSDQATLGVTARRRSVRWQPAPLTAEQIAQALTAHPVWRILVVVNTVQRAIELARAIEASLGRRDQLAVLHSRFYQSDRKAHEDVVMAAFTRPDERTGHVHIAVATQVVEVGLDISADLIFTELAPASALVQRWGRSARWGGNAEIVIAPPSPDANARVYPYTTQEDRAVVSKTRAWLEDNAGGAGILMDATSERDLLDVAHREADEQWASSLSAILTDRASDIGKAIAEGRYDLAGSLIRQVDTRTVLICGAPEGQLQQPFGMEGFPLAPGSLMSLLPKKERPPATSSTFETLEDDQGEGMISFDLPSDVLDPSDALWRLRYPVWARDVEDSETQANIVDHWEDVTRRTDITNQPVLAINPALVAYDDFYGLSLRAGESPVPESYWAHPVERQISHMSFSVGSRQSEIYEQHIARMLALYEGHPVLGPRLTRITAIVEEWLGWPTGMLDRLIRAAIVAHDAGKLSPAWQAGIASYQQAINRPMRPWLVHTDDPHGRKPPWSVPPHALSGAAHSVEVGVALDAEVTATGHHQFAGALPSNVLFTAIATHHAPNISDWSLTERMLLADDGISELNRLLASRQLPSQAIQMDAQSLQGYGVAQGDIASNLGAGESYALALVTRMLRFADSWSQDTDRLRVVEKGGQQ